MEKVDVNLKTLVHSAIMLILMFGFQLVPPPDGITSYGMAVSGVFFGLVYGWTFLGILWPSLLGVLGLAFTGYGTVEHVALAMFNNSTVLMMLLGTISFAALAQSGAADYVMGKLIGSKLSQKSPLMLVDIIFFAVLLASALDMCMVLYFGIFPVMISTLKKCGYEKGDRFNVMFLTGFMLAVQLGMAFKPFLGWGLMTIGTIQSITQTQLSYGLYMLLMLIIYVVFIITYPFLMKICGCDFQKMAEVDITTAFNVREGKMSLRQILSLGSLLIFLAIVIVFSVAGSHLGALNNFYIQIGILGMMLILWIAMIVIKVDGKPLMDMRKASADFGWDMLFLIAIALLVSSCLTSEGTGISAWLAGLITPLFPGGGVSFLIALGAATLFLTNVANNIAVCFIMINIVCAMYLNGFPVDLLAASMLISVSALVAFLTPASSMPGAMIHASGVVTPKSIYQIMPIILLYILLLLLIIIIPGTLLFA